MPATAAPPASKSAASAADDAFFRPAGQKIQANLEMLLGATVALKFEGARRMTAAEAQASAPESGAIIVGGLGNGADGEALILLERPLALMLSCLLQMLPEAAIKARLGDLATNDLSDSERESVGEIGNFMVAAVGERLRDLGGASFKLTQEPTRYLSGTAATDAATAIAADGYLGVVGVMKAGAFDEYRVSVLLADALGRTVAPKAYEDPSASDDGGGSAPASNGSAEAGSDATAPATGTPPAGTVRHQTRPPAGTPGRPARASAGGAPAAAGVAGCSEGAGVVDYTGRTAGLAASGPTAARLAALVPSGAKATVLPGLGAAYDAMEAGTPPSLVVVEVGAGKEHLLDLTAAVRRHPAAAKSAFLVLLGRPTRRNVMRCATAGLFDVLPADAADDLLQRRIAHLLRPVAD